VKSLTLMFGSGWLVVKSPCVSQLYTRHTHRQQPTGRDYNTNSELVNRSTSQIQPHILYYTVYHKTSNKRRIPSSLNAGPLLAETQNCQRSRQWQTYTSYIFSTATLSADRDNSLLL